MSATGLKKDFNHNLSFGLYFTASIKTDLHIQYQQLAYSDKASQTVIDHTYSKCYYTVYSCIRLHLSSAKHVLFIKTY